MWFLLLSLCRSDSERKFLGFRSDLCVGILLHQIDIFHGGSLGYWECLGHGKNSVSVCSYHIKWSLIELGGRRWCRWWGYILELWMIENSRAKRFLTSRFVHLDTKPTGPLTFFSARTYTNSSCPVMVSISLQGPWDIPGSSNSKQS